MNLVHKMSDTLKQSDNGLWMANGVSNVSYPSDGNLMCHQFENDSYWFNHRNQIILDMIRGFQSEDLILDIGGGNGFVAKFLIDNGINIALLEPGIDGARNAMMSGVAPVICSTLEESGIHNQILGGAGLFDVLEHVSDDTKFLKDIRSKLKPRGKLYLTVPAMQLLWSSEDEYAGHYRRYSLKSLSSVLQNAGFEILYTTYFFTVLSLPVFLLRTVPSWIGVRKTADISQYRKEHTTSSETVSKVLNKILYYERSLLLKQKYLPFGTSCLAVAQVKDI